MWKSENTTHGGLFEGEKSDLLSGFFFLIVTLRDDIFCYQLLKDKFFFPINKSTQIEFSNKKYLYFNTFHEHRLNPYS